MEPGSRSRVMSPTDPVPGRGPLVRVHLVGICCTDLEITRGYLGFRGTPGHEWTGRVVQAEDAGLVGARVVGEMAHVGAQPVLAGHHEEKLLRARSLGIETP